ncbi:hypothetical protein PaG_01128 [Moesziomyces aphidis]|uniref:Uncharacterized protein n=1 Tax=Moesziomyces aphidis TaxID=84754 RepID=W3VRX5_MOEAP|nr:hypothetical protein PaG_01128 [Moesziomyces aphidis]
MPTSKTLSSYNKKAINGAIPLLLEAQNWDVVGYRGLRRMVGCKHLKATKKVKDTAPNHKQAGGADCLHLAQELGHWCTLSPATSAPATALPSIRHQEGMSAP